MVSVSAEHGTEVTGVVYAGPTIQGDPREHPPEITVDTIVAIATDPRLRLMTSQEVVDAGAAVTDWSGVDPDPHAYDVVPQTDLGQVAAMLLLHGGYASYHDPQPSPLRSRFGPGAIGGRVVRRGVTPADPSRLDILAAPQLPTWLGARPCRTGVFARHCARLEDPHGPVFVMWHPARGDRRGVVWVVQVRPSVVVGLRTVGRRVPPLLDEVLDQVTWRGETRALVRCGLVGLTTQKRVLDFDLGQLGG